MNSLKCCSKFLLMWGLIVAHAGCVILAAGAFVVAMVAS
jgi:hypothetical protein